MRDYCKVKLWWRKTVSLEFLKLFSWKECTECSPGKLNAAEANFKVFFGINL